MNLCRYLSQVSFLSLRAIISDLSVISMPIVVISFRVGTKAIVHAAPDPLIEVKVRRVLKQARITLEPITMCVVVESAPVSGDAQGM